MGKIVRGVIAAILAAVWGVAPVSAAADTTLKIGGSGGALGAIQRLAAEFRKQHPEVRVQVLPSLGSSGGIKALMDGAIDLAVSGRALKPDEKARGAMERKYARTPFVFIAHKKVGKPGITTQELERFYAGAIKDWPDGTPIRLVLRPAGDTDTKLLRDISPAMDAAVKAAIAKEGINFAVTDQDSIDMVAKIPGSFGGATLGQILTEKPAVKVLTFNGVRPDAKAMAKGTYPLSKTLYLISMPKTSAMARQFEAFIASPAGKRILANAGNQPL